MSELKLSEDVTLADELYDFIWELLGEGDERRALVAGRLRARAAALEAENKRLRVDDNPACLDCSQRFVVSGCRSGYLDILHGHSTQPCPVRAVCAPDALEAEVERLRVNAARYEALERAWNAGQLAWTQGRDYPFMVPPDKKPDGSWSSTLRLCHIADALRGQAKETTP